MCYLYCVKSKNLNKKEALAKLDEKSSFVAPDHIKAKIRSFLEGGETLPEDQVSFYLHLARDYALLMMTSALADGVFLNKDCTSLFNSLQNAVERYEMLHKSSTDNEEPVEYIIVSPVEREELGRQLLGEDE